MRSLAAALALAVSGCSFVTVDGPPPTVRYGQTVLCTSDMRGPTIDMILLGLTGLVSLAIAASEDDPSTPDMDESEGAAVAGAVTFAVGGGAFLASALWGRNKVSQCRRAIEASTIAERE